MPELDLFDRKLLYELDLGARQSASQLARKLRKSKETVNFRIRRLIANGYIKGFYTVFNASALGWYYFKVFVKLHDITPSKEEEMLHRICQMPRVSYVAKMDGYYDSIFLIMVRHADQMESFMIDFMGQYGNFVLEKQVLVRLTAHRLNQRFTYGGNESKDWHYPVRLGSYDVDRTDMKLIRAIAEDSRSPLIAIAKKAGVDAKTASYRIKKMEKDKIILSYVSALNFDALGRQFVQVNISLRDLSAKKGMLEFFKSTDTCMFASEMLGKYDFGVELHVLHSHQLTEILNVFKARFAGTYNVIDVGTITREYRTMKGPFGSETLP